MTWHYLQYLLGLRRLGWEVLYLEDTGQWTYDPVNRTFVDDPNYSVQYIARVMSRHGLDDRWSFRAHDGTVFGVDSGRVLDFCGQSELFLNVSGSCWLRPEYQHGGSIVYLDTDPGYAQVNVAKYVSGSTDSDLRYSVERMAEHHHHFTFAENIGSKGCAVPLDMFDWRPTRQPIFLDAWEASPDRGRDVFTTVLSWSPYSEPLRFRSRSYWGKEPNFRTVLSIPTQVSERLELAVSGAAPRQLLIENGWQITDGHDATRDAQIYQHYLASSKGEFSVAKDIYVDMWTGWFSERSACYLASGRPVVTQDTGFSDLMPTGSGLLSYRSAEEAVASLGAVESNYLAHCDAARDIAETYFDSDLVLSDLLDKVLPA